MRVDFCVRRDFSRAFSGRLAESAGAVEQVALERFLVGRHLRGGGEDEVPADGGVGAGWRGGEVEGRVFVEGALALVVVRRGS